MLRRIIIYTALCVFAAGILQAQTIEPQGVFDKDTLKIGEEISFTLSLKYQKTLNVLFPDSLADFAPFEYISREYFPTKTSSLYSTDSVIYRLSTFEIDAIQYLQLPVYVIKDGDSVVYFSKADSIFLKRVIEKIPEKPEPKSNTAMVKIKKAFNYPYFFIAMGVVLFGLLITALFFGKRLVKAWKIRRMKKSHSKFTQRFLELMRDVSGSNPTTTPEHVLTEWKKYVERLERKPITKLTTREILVLHPADVLKENLRTLDRVIYGNEQGHDLYHSFDKLLSFSVEVFNEKIQAIQNG